MIPNPPQTQGNIQPRRPGSKKGQLVLGILLMITASTTFIFGIVSVSLPTLYYGYGGNPLWTGVVILIGGILSVCSSKTMKKCYTTSALVMNIISIVFAFDQILWMSVAAANENYNNENCGYYYHHYYDYGYKYYSDSDCDAERAIDIVLAVLGVIELGLAIAAVCVLSVDMCCPGTQRTMGVYYQAGQPVVVQGGYVQPVGPAYPPQTHFVTQSGQMYVHQTAGAYPTVQVQYPAGQPQQYPVGQPQQHPTGQPQQYSAGQPQQYSAGQPQYPAGQPAQGVDPQNAPTYTEQKY